ncbi:hypothetical protein SAMN05192539_10612 [Paraburkholderia diazotrophica]|uniref:Uncharacterized protein n=1 Tax=Paraburkholderia diazotrophica TaxID=667676 RepID=A0A1H7EFU8_9BURK|nr:hypothetical protein SAMN05192539_10612 [Paraburkholderia diazotrophica]
MHCMGDTIISDYMTTWMLNFNAVHSIPVT